MMNKTNRYLMIYLIIAGILISGCAGTTLKDTYVNESLSGKPVSDILVIAVTENERIRRSFEEKFVKQFVAEGIEAISSFDAITIKDTNKLEKEAIVKAVDKFNNDAVIITHLKGIKEKEVYTPPTRTPVYHNYGYYGYYNYVYDYVYTPGYSKIHTIVRLETNLYDVKTEKLIWSGVSETMDAKSNMQLIEEVIAVVVKELRKKNLLLKK